ncbi:MAG: type II toxin-antitoxin system RelE/ParE family toxin [Gammaproteobacteria bacterium]|nr:type II toxin-antitoxin system RelE/ParE family toxin [Gammaproteobacteria bacterium]
MIQSFNCDNTRVLFEGGNPRQFLAFNGIATRKLTYLDAALESKDLVSPPGNRLENLRGDKTGQYSIRISDQWRPCFVWGSSGPTNVEIADYR